jgi:hypothetical protein
MTLMRTGTHENKIISFTWPPRNLSSRNRQNPFNVLRDFRLPFGFFTLEDGTDKLLRNVGKKLPLLAARLIKGIVCGG